MANRFFQPGDERAARVQDLFEGIARRYDRINDLQSLGLHRLWKRQLVQRAGAGPGGRVLDLCCGTGDVALRLARRGAGTTAVDFSGAMLDVARRRISAAAAGGLRLRWVRGDALRLPFADDSFDAVTISYGLRNLASAEAGLREMQRVARPGGRLLVLDFGKPGNALWRRVYFAYLRWLVPVFGRVCCGDAQAYAYIRESLEHYPAQEGVAAILRGLGCRNVSVSNLLGGAMSINCAEKAG
jgi:demethylmenaquinone methyltransferase/2-methoxy-6-polyprenyl-1,4-benzoquinol methylase